MDLPAPLGPSNPTVLGQLDGDNVDAIVQAGTNLSAVDIFPALEKRNGTVSRREPARSFPFVPALLIALGPGGLWWLWRENDPRIGECG